MRWRRKEDISDGRETRWNGQPAGVSETVTVPGYKERDGKIEGKGGKGRWTV